MERTPAPAIGGQYGLARDVFSTAAAKMGMDADDLQAVAWFLETELWEKQGWTPVADEPSLVKLINEGNTPEMGAQARQRADIMFGSTP